MQRYLTGRSIAQSRLSLLFNAVAKIPMQFFILFIGAMVFVFYLFVQPPILFHNAELRRIHEMRQYAPLTDQYDRVFEQRHRAALALVEAHHAGDPASERRMMEAYRAANEGVLEARTQAAKAYTRRRGGWSRGGTD